MTTTSARPSGTAPLTGNAASFVLTERRRSALFVDLHLSDGHARLTWAVPNGPPSDPRARRLAIACEPDGPAAIAGAYDRGSVQFHGAADLRNARGNGRIDFTLNGSRLRGGFSLFHVGGLNWVLQRVDGPAAEPATVPASRATGGRRGLHPARTTSRTTAGHAPRRRS